MRATLWLSLAVALTACVSIDESGDVADSSTPAPIEGPGGGGSFGFGRTASAQEIAALDIDVGPDGAGLPAGRATVDDGLAIYQARCAVCHGVDGTGGPNDVLAGRIPGDGFPFATEAARSTVGNYWPYATTLFDYIRKAMPFDAPGSLTDEEVYGAVAAILYLNELVAADAVVDSATIAGLVMPARDRFVPDDRAGGPTIR
ncbi:MAG: cytochrome c [Gemmatimonadota bacterium]|nr:cytochrome c [Gemmatimonadota bacterium]